jgi:serine protease
MTTRTRAVLLLAAAALALTWRVQARSDGDRAGTLAPIAAGPAATALLIDVADRLTPVQLQALLDSIEGERLNSEHSEAEGLYRVEGSPSEIAALAAQLRGDPRVEAVEPEVLYAVDEVEAARRLPAAPDDPLYAFQWHLDQIGVPGAWAGADGDGVIVAVIDTGVAYADSAQRGVRRVQDLAGTAFVAGYDFVDDRAEGLDFHGHGTHVAGTIAQTTNNGYGVAGVAPRAKIMPLRVLDAQGRGTNGDIADAIRFAADNGAHVINMSLGGPLPSRILGDAIQHARSRGVVVIAAAGNSGSAVPSYPAAYPGVIAVAATQFDRTATFYSNRGPHIDIAAPGGNTRLDQNGDGRPDGVLQETLARGNPADHEFALYMGTSMASPHVAGVAALVRSAGVTHPERIEEILLSTSNPAPPANDRIRYGAGLVDADAAVRRAAAGDGATRSLLALLLALAIGAGRSTRLAASVARAASATIVAGGLALPLFLGACAGLSAPAALGAPLLEGLTHGAPWLAANALVMSALPALGLYALFGGVRGPVARNALIGVIAGLGVWLLAASIAPRHDLALVPGSGALDAVWLAVNGVVAMVAAAVAARPAAPEA